MRSGRGEPLALSIGGNGSQRRGSSRRSDEYDEAGRDIHNSLY